MCVVPDAVPELNCANIVFARPMIPNGFIGWFLRSQLGRTSLLALTTGAAQGVLNTTSIAQLPVPVPPLEVQEQIVSILSAYDDLIDNNTRRIAILEEMARALYQEWFVHFRFPGHESIRLVDSPLGAIPEGWEVVSFVDIADVQSGGTPRKTEPAFWGGAIPFYTPRDAPNSIYASSTASSITEEGLARCNSRLYPKDTIFITARGTVGSLALASTSMAMNQSCYALSGRHGISQAYLLEATRFLVAQLKQQTHGAVFDTIIVDTFRRLRTIRPTDQLVAAFSKMVSPMFGHILALLHKNENLRTTRDLLLPKLISGEIEVSRAEEEVAEAAD